jgi:RNA recognition motif-containing protein
MNRKLYVGNLPYEVGEAELQNLFGQAGQVDSVRVMRDMATGRARGFAFVEMGTEEAAQKAISELNATELGGRSLTVNEARPKPEYAGAGGPSGGGRSRREPRW